MTGDVIIPVAVSDADVAAALPYPGEDPAALDAAGGRIAGAIRVLTTLSDRMDGARVTLLQVWRGVSAQAATEEIDRVRRALEDGTERLDRARTALFRCADRLQDIRTRIDGLRWDWRRAESSVRTLDLALLTELEPTRRQTLTDLRTADALDRSRATVGGADALTAADEATLECRSTLTATISGEQVFVAGRGVVTAGLGTALGTAAMTSDDEFRAGLALMGDDDERWDSLGVDAQAFALATAGTPPAVPDSPAMQAAWWSSRTWAERQALIHAHPATVGATDGLPVVARDQANRLALGTRAQILQEALDTADPAVVGAALGVRDLGDGLALTVAMGMLRQGQSTIAGLRSQLAVTRSQPVFLIDVAPTGRGQAVVSIGDPDTADHVATYVPGTGSDVSGLRDGLDRVEAWTAGTAEFGAGTTAGVAWLDYQSPPDVIAAAHDSYADAAAPALGAFQNGLRASHQGEPSRNVVIGHSYGALVIGAAGTGGNVLDADGLVLVGPVGLEVGSVQDLRLVGVPAEEMGDRVLTVMHDNDPIRWTTFAHPGASYDTDFGGHVLVTGSVGDGNDWAWHALDPIGAGAVVTAVDEVFDQLQAHGDYQDPGSIEQRVISAFIAGQLVMR